MHKRIYLPINNNNQIMYVSETIVDDTFKTIPHSHPNLEIILFIDGEGQVITSSKKINVKKGDLMIINSASKHYEKSNNLNFFALGINGFEVFLEHTFKNKIISHSLTGSSYYKILNIYEQIYKEAIEKQSNYIDIINYLFNVLRIVINREINLSFNLIDSQNQSSITSSCKQIIENHFYTHINLKDIAKRLSVSVSYLCHQFKKDTGVSIIEYKLKNQIEEAKNLLLITDLSISEISQSVGFSSSAYFNKIFKKVTNINPKEYRKVNKNTNSY